MATTREAANSVRVLLNAFKGLQQLQEVLEQADALENQKQDSRDTIENLKAESVRLKQENEKLINDSKLAKEAAAKEATAREQEHAIKLTVLESSYADRAAVLQSNFTSTRTRLDNELGSLSEKIVVAREEHATLQDKLATVRGHVDGILKAATN